MFNKNFYPTPDNAIEILTKGIDFRYMSEASILEPSAGKGNIIDYINSLIRNDESINIDAIEIEPELQSILFDKKCVVVADDFLGFETNSEYNYIIMNPPFDSGDKHLVKAIQIAEAQIENKCEIRCILNAETIRNAYSNNRRYLTDILDLHNATIEYHTNLFSGSERSTNVEVAIIKMTVFPFVRYNNLFEHIVDGIDEGQASTLDESALSTFVAKSEIEKRLNDIKLYIRLYKEHISAYKRMYAEMNNLNTYTQALNDFTKNDFGYNRAAEVSIHRNHYGGSSTPYIVAVDELRSNYWKLILSTEEFSKVLTQDATRTLQKQIEMASRMEINETNVYKLLQALYANKGNILTDALVKKFSDLTKNHMKYFSKNIHYYNGWKTNDAYKVNKKVIVNTTSSWDNRHECMSFRGGWENELQSNIKYFMSDLIKALNPISDYPITDDFHHIGDGVYENDHFSIKCYIKGTSHITFKDLMLLDRFNVIAGQHFNWLPTDEEIKSNPEARTFVENEFPNIDTKLLGE